MLLMKLIKNEFIKIFSKKKTWIVFFLLFAGLVGMNYLCHKEALEAKERAKPENRIKNDQMYIDEYLNERVKETKEDLRKAKEDKKSDSEITKLSEIAMDTEAELKEVQKNIKELQKEIDNPIKKDWRDEVRKNIAKAKKDMKGYNSEDFNQPGDIGNDAKIESERLKKMVESYQYYLDNNIEPIDQYGFSIGENLKNIFHVFGIGILAVGIAVFMCDIVSGECTPPTFKFLLVQPVSRSKVLLSKIIAINITVLGLILGAEILTTVIGVGLFDGFDSLKSLIHVGEQYELIKESPEVIFNMIPGSGYYITYGEYIVKGLLYQSLFIVTVTSFVFMISTLFKSSTISMSITVILAAIGGGLPNTDLIKSGLQYSFLSYGDTGDLIDGYLGLRLFFEGDLWSYSVMIMLITIIVCYTISFLRFRRRDILV